MTSTRFLLFLLCAFGGVYIVLTFLDIVREHEKERRRGDR